MWSGVQQNGYCYMLIDIKSVLKLSQILLYFYDSDRLISRQAMQDPG